MAYCSTKIEIDVYPSIEDGQGTNDRIARLTDQIDEAVYNAICSALQGMKDKFTELPGNVSITISVFGDEYNLVLYPMLNKQRIVLGDSLTWTDRLLDGGSMGEAKGGLKEVAS